MQVPTVTDLLNVWDSGFGASHAERALLLLETLRPEQASQFAAMPLGWVTAQLLQLHVRLMGPALACVGTCPRCEASVECEIGIDQITTLAECPASATGILEIRQESYRVEYRLPTCEDLLVLSGDTQTAALTLAHRLILNVTHAGAVLEPAELPPELSAAVEAAVLENDPLVQMELQLVCPTCGYRWTEALEIVDFVWREVSVLAQQLLADVARLAYAFGWKESDILAMSHQRRRRYLEMLPA
jgi:hypothetical protein